MSKRTESNVYTILFAIGMVVVVGALLAFTASSLKSTIAKNKELEIQQNMLYAMGVNENDPENKNSVEFVSTQEAPELFHKYIKEQLVLDDKGNILKEVDGDKIVKNYDASFDKYANYGDDVFLMDVKKEQANAKEGKTRRLPLMVGEKDGKTFYIAPIRGKGLWDAIWAYISMDENMVIEGAYFDHKGETPGLGANIKERFFMDDFTGEHLLDANGNFKGVDVSKSNADPTNKDKTDNEVDAIAGATITGNGVSAMIKDDLRLYVPFFKNLKQ